MIRNFPSFNAKILLFGEYTALSGSKALIVPFTRFSGRLEFGSLESPVQQVSNKSLRFFFEYLEKSKSGFPDGLNFDMDRFNSDLDKGLFLNSDVPQGYGAGSSGVVVASVYAEYAINPVSKLKSNDIGLLKKYFSVMESGFHGKSSGLDPLSSYIKKPLLFSSPENIEIVDFPSEKNDSSINIFLLDSGLTAKTEGLVQLFMEKSKNRKYRDIIEKEIIPRNNECIDSIRNGRIADFFEEIKPFSSLQLENFTEMIPVQIVSHWESGLRNGLYSLKLCGSGGGGFILGFTDDFKKTDEYFRKMGMKLIHVFKNN